MRRVIYLFSFLLSCLSVQAGNIQLTWQAPTTNTDGTPLTDLAGYKLYYWQTDPALAVSINVGNQTAYTITGLTEGQIYQFAATAYDAFGNESDFSNVVSGVIGAAISSPVTDVSRSDYEVVSLHVGDTYYTDRGFTIIEMPALLEGITAIKTANNDKHNQEAELLTFIVGKDATVYVAYDTRATHYPEWLTAFYTPTGEIINTTDVPLALWRRDVTAGTVSLPGNIYGNPGGVDSNYLVLITLTESLSAAVLPASRSTQVHQSTAAFATIINTGSNTAIDCAIDASTEVPAEFSYQTSDPVTNALTGNADTPVSIPAGQAQSFVISFTPNAVFNSTVVTMRFECANKKPASVIYGVNTLLLSASATPVPDIVAIAVAAGSMPGIVDISDTSGSAAFAVATSNLGDNGNITAFIDTGHLPLNATICQSDPQTSLCMDTPDTTVTSQIGPGATPTFVIFMTANGVVPLDPAHNRVFVYFQDSNGIDRGSTSVAVQTIIADDN